MYTAAGLVVLLLTSQQEYVGGIMVVYLILASFSAFLESETADKHISARSRLGWHMTVVVIVVSVTIFSFESVLRVPEPDDSPHLTTYEVAVPYFDLTLDRHLGVGKLEGRQFVYVTRLEAISREEAVETEAVNDIETPRAK